MRRYYDTLREENAVCAVFREQDHYEAAVEAAANDGDYVCYFNDGTYEIVTEEEFKGRFKPHRSQDMKDG